MNLNKIKKDLSKKFKDYFKFDYKYEGNTLAAYAQISIAPLDKDTLFTAVIGDNNVVLYFFSFDEIERNEETLTLINKYNNNVDYFRAYIDEDSELCLEHDSFLVEDKDIADYTLGVLLKLLDDKSLEYLKLLTDLTTVSE